MKSVLQVCLSEARGGLEMSVITAVLSFQREGHKSSCVCIRGSYVEQELRASGLDIAIFPVEVKGKYFDRKASSEISKAIDQARADVVVLHSLRDIWIVYWALWRKPTRLVGICRMFIRGVNKKDFLHRMLYRRFQHIVTLCSSQKTELLNCIPFDESKTSIVPNGVNTKTFSPSASGVGSLRADWLTASDQIIVGYVGRLDRQKGLLELIEAIGAVNTANDPVRKQTPVRLVTVGDETEGEPGFKNEMRALVEKLGLTKDVLMLPARKDVPEVMRSFDIFVMPSYEEAFGKVLIEAMACGLPCISTSAGGPLDILKGQDIGILVKPKSAEELATAIALLARDQKLRKIYAENSRNKAVQDYDHQVVFKKLEAAVLGS